MFCPSRQTNALLLVDICFIFCGRQCPVQPSTDCLAVFLLPWPSGQVLIGPQGVSGSHCTDPSWFQVQKRGNLLYVINVLIPCDSLSPPLFCRTLPPCAVRSPAPWSRVPTQPCPMESAARAVEHVSSNPRITMIGSDSMVLFVWFQLHTRSNIPAQTKVHLRFKEVYIQYYEPEVYSILKPLIAWVVL